MSRVYTVKAQSGYRYNDPYLLFLEQLADMREIARTATQKAHSYREKPVKVGTALLSIVEGSLFWGITDGFNTKKAGQEKNCSERKALEKAKFGGFTRAIGMVVTSSTTRDEIHGITGVKTPTLMPCGVCQGDFRGDPVARDNMIIVTAGLDHDVIQVNTAGRIHDIMSSGDTDRLVHDRTLSDVDFSRLPGVYMSLKDDQAYVPEAKRLAPEELVTLAILSHRNLYI